MLFPHPCHAGRFNNERGVQMKKIYLATCGEILRGESSRGFNPPLTAMGTSQIVAVRNNLVPKIPKPPLVVVGTGTRFIETYLALAPAFPSVPVRRSLFCGCGDCLQKDDKVATVNGCVPVNEYIGLIDTPGFNPWLFIDNWPAGTLFCTGGELLIALERRDLYKDGALIEIDLETTCGHQIT